MAKRRCFSIDVFESDKCFELSTEAKVLYTYLMLNSDDEGIISNTHYMMRMLGFSNSILNELIEQEFIIKLDDLYVIAHWHIHNKIPPSKKNPSVYQKKLEKLYLNSEGIYELG